ncbi:MAG TPA: myo-inosose-2 dehydratase [Aestuariivirgaceae bacterium]|jgi:myo-inosose-2 dehydratase
MLVRIGANPICWSNDDMPELGGHITLEQCLTEAKAAGYEGMELGHKFPRTPVTLKSVLTPHDLALVGGWYSTFLLERDAEKEFQEAQDHIRLLKAMGSEVFIAAECSNSVHGNRSKRLSTRPKMNNGDWSRFSTELTRFAEMVAGEGLPLTYHHHMGTVVQTEPEIDQLMKKTGPAVRLLLDTGHATWAGANPKQLAHRYRRRIGHVHTKDVRKPVMQRANDNDLSFLDSVVAGVYTVPGDGMVDFTGVLKELKGYTGWIVVEAEQDPVKAPPADYVKLGYDNLTRFIRTADLKR